MTDTIIPVPCLYCAAVANAHMALTTASIAVTVKHLGGTGKQITQQTAIKVIVAGTAANITVKFKIQPIQQNATAAIVNLLL